MFRHKPRHHHHHHYTAWSGQHLTAHKGKKTAEDVQAHVQAYVSKPSYNHTHLVVCIVQPGGAEHPAPLLISAAHAALPELREQQVALATHNDVPAGEAPMGNKS
jgi:hypothetical protein